MHVFLSHVFLSIFLCLIVFVCLTASGVCLEKHKENKGILFAVMGILVIGVLGFSPLWNPSGLPLKDIDPGTYKIGLVYVAGDNVNVALEWKTGEKGTSEKIYYYQFKKDAFEGTLNSNAQKLIVVQSGNFKKLRLE